MKDIEIIIPAYNAQSTIIKTLTSLSVQKNTPSFHITIVNDCGKDYKEIILKYQSKLDISEISTPKNVGPGLARQYGIDKTKSKYILFIDSDDYLADEYSLQALYDKIDSSEADVVISNFIYERDNKKLIKEKNTVWLHGKIYRRSFLEKHNIKFNSTRANEDNGFNSLIFLLNPIVVYLDKVTYVYHENEHSITRKNNRLYKFTGLEWYSYNINWAIEEALKRKVPRNSIAIKIIEGLSVMYFSYLDLYNEYNVEKILEWSKPLYLRYLSYQDLCIKYESIALQNENFINVKRTISFTEFQEKINRLL